MNHEEYLRRVKSYIKTPTKDMEQQLQDFCSICTYISGQYDKDESFVQLRNHLEELEKNQKESNRIFYMALPPSVFTTVSQHLKKNCYPKNGLARIIVSSHGAYAVTWQINNLRDRSRSHLVRILRAPETCKKPWSRTGMRKRFSVLTTTWGRRW